MKENFLIDNINKWVHKKEQIKSKDSKKIHIKKRTQDTGLKIQKTSKVNTIRK